MQSGWLGLYLMERAIARYKHGRSIPPSSNIVHVLLQVNGPFNYSNSVNGAVQVSSFHLKKNLLQKSATPFFLAEEVVILKNCHFFLNISSSGQVSFLCHSGFLCNLLPINLHVSWQTCGIFHTKEIVFKMQFWLPICIFQVYGFWK